MKKWYAVAYGPYWEIQDGPLYGDARMLSEEDVGDKAKEHAKLAAAAPELLHMVIRSLNLLLAMETCSGMDSQYFEDAKKLINQLKTT